MVRWEWPSKSWQQLRNKLTGRSVSSCMAVWQQLHANVQARYPAPSQPMVTFEQPFSQNASKPKKKQRPASGENVSSTVDRMLQPQLPLNFPSVNSPGDPASDQGVTASVLGGPQKKKRGRPSKVEHEAKVAEAAARGEIYQPTPKRKKAPRSSLEGAPNVGMVTPSMTEVGTTGEGSASKTRTRKPKSGIEETGGLVSEPTARSLGLEATAFRADQMHFEDGKAFKSTIPETQASDIESRESLSADMGGIAERTAPDTFQSTMTLRHDSTPRTDYTSYRGPSRDAVRTGEQHYL